MTSNEACSCLLNEKLVEKRIKLLQEFIIDPPCELDEQLHDVVDELRNSDDNGIRFWAKKVFTKYFSNLPAKNLPQNDVKEDEPLEPGEITLDMLVKKLNTVKRSRFNSITVLQKIFDTRDSAAVTPLLEYLKTSADDFQISFLTKNLGIFFPSDNLLSVLCNYLSHRDPRVVANTVEGIEAIGSAKSFAVCARLVSHPNNRVRANAAKAISRFDEKKAEEIILRMLSIQTQPHVVISGCYAARELKNPRFIPVLKELLGNDLVVDDAIGALLAINKKEAMLILDQAAKNTRSRLEKLDRAIGQNSSSSFSISENKHVLAIFLFPAVLLGIYFLFPSAPTSRDEARKTLELSKVSFTQEEFIKCLEGNRQREVELFIRAGMDVNQKNVSKSSPLHFCAYFSQVTLIDILLNAKANVNAQDDKGLTPLHLSNNRSIAEKLIQAGAEINRADYSGKTPLHRVIESGVNELVELLLSKGANVNFQDSDGNTPLHIALYTNQKKIVSLLLSRGANKDIRNKSKISPRDLGV